MSAIYSGEVIDLVEAELNQPFLLPDQEVPRREEVIWHRTVLDVILEVDNEESSDKLAGTILDLSRRLLHELADDETIEQFLSNPTDKDNLAAIRRFRKLLMIGRDGLRATSEFKNRPGHPISKLGHYLGVIGDTQGEDSESVTGALQELRNMPASLEIVDTYEPDSLFTVHKRLNRRHDYLGANSDDEGIDPDMYHSIRIGERRIVHVSILSVIAHRTPQKERLTTTGLQLNTEYGRRHDAMLGNQPAD